MKKISLFLLIICLFIQTLFAQQKRTVAISITSKSNNAKTLINACLAKEINNLSNLRLIADNNKADFVLNIISIQNDNLYTLSSTITEHKKIKGYGEIEKFWINNLFITLADDVKEICVFIRQDLKQAVSSSALNKRFLNK